MDEPAKAALSLPRAQATQVYAGLKLWPDAVMARLAEAQLVADGTYPNAAAVFAEYLRRYGNLKYYDFLREFMGAVCKRYPDLNPDTIHWDWFRVTTPGGDQYYPLEFHGDLGAWIDRMIAVAIENGTTMAWFDRGKFCLNDGSKMAFGDLRIDRLKGGEEAPDDW